jgi:hypothetical protein
MQSAYRKISPARRLPHHESGDNIRALREVVVELAERIELLEARERLAEHRFAERQAGTVRVFE